MRLTGWLGVNVILLSIASASWGQNLLLESGVHLFSDLKNTNVVLGGKVEVWVADSDSPLFGSVIDFQSEDAWLILPALRPSEVISQSLRQFRVQGDRAVVGSNIRITAYQDGCIVIPHGPGYLPLEVFNSTHGQGVSRQFGLYTYYRESALRGLNDSIRSFYLKRGYMVTLAANGDGTGASRVYIAQDGDLKVDFLPEELDVSISFIRVMPWRWTGKKGWAGEKEPLMKPLWHYDWNNATTSSADMEYVPMRHNLFWNSYGNINEKQDSTHVLGFNEPDRPDQANMTVEEAILQWPHLLASGLRLGAPAPSDASAGLDWLYEFIDQADALGYRVDFVPVHFYKGGWSAGQYYNWLEDIYHRTGRPIWITEFNNGANWTCCEPTFESQSQVIGEFIAMLDNAPFVERYAIYNWVGPTREMVADGNLTPAGRLYREQKSSLAYPQEVPGGKKVSVAQYKFDGDTLDNSGYGNHAISNGAPRFVNGRSGLALAFDGEREFVRLPEQVAHGRNFTFAAWVKWNGGASWQRIFDFGNNTSEYLFLTPNAAGAGLRFAIKNGGSEQRLETSPLIPGRWTHVAVTLSRNSGTLYVNGNIVDRSDLITLDPNDFNASRNYLGRSQFAADPLFNGLIEDVVISNEAFSSARIERMILNRPPTFDSRLIQKTAYLNQEILNASLLEDVSDPDDFKALSFRKIDGPNWVNLSANGTLTGIPTENAGGTNTIVVQVSDSAGMSDYAVIDLNVQEFPEPPALSWSIEEGNVRIQWPEEYLGWQLQVRREWGEGFGWVDISGSNAVTEWTVEGVGQTIYFRLAFE